MLPSTPHPSLKVHATVNDSVFYQDKLWTIKGFYDPGTKHKKAKIQGKWMPQPFVDVDLKPVLDGDLRMLLHTVPELLSEGGQSQYNSVWLKCKMWDHSQDILFFASANNWIDPLAVRIFEFLDGVYKRGYPAEAAEKEKLDRRSVTLIQIARCCNRLQ